MKLKVINSNSKGNCYILGNENEQIIIELGVKFSEIKKALNHDLSKVQFCLQTHEHQDHSKAANDVINSGLQIISSRGTFEKCKINPDNQIVIKHGQRITYKDWKISAFNAEHDCVEPIGFIIEHSEIGRVLFITDSYKLKYNLGAFDYVIIEANYCEDIVRSLRLTGKYNSFLESRRLTSHMSFQTAIHTLKRLDLSHCNGIMLIHLSDLTTNEKKFIEATENEFGISTVCANPGTEIDLKIDIF